VWFLGHPAGPGAPAHVPGHLAVVPSPLRDMDNTSGPVPGSRICKGCGDITIVQGSSLLFREIRAGSIKQAICMVQKPLDMCVMQPLHDFQKTFNVMSQLHCTPSLIREHGRSDVHGVFAWLAKGGQGRPHSQSPACTHGQRRGSVCAEFKRRH
jgi:hypothetical protein